MRNPRSNSRMNPALRSFARRPMRKSRRKRRLKLTKRKQNKCLTGWHETAILDIWLGRVYLSPGVATITADELRGRISGSSFTCYGGHTLTQDSYIKAKLVEMGWRFGRTYSGGHSAGQMVMQTLANRVKSGWGSWLKIFDHVPMFMAEKEIPPLEHPTVWEPSFIKLLQTVDGIVDGSVPDLAK